jgi:hypothetical protein
MTVTSMREGATADSKTPRSTLVVTRPAQFFAADVQTTMMPHCVRVLVNISSSVQFLHDQLTRATIVPRYFAVGSVCMPYA